jgi:hypothetical protein
MGEIKASKVSRGKSEGNRQLQKSTYRYKDNIKMDLLEIVCEDTEWLNWAQNSVHCERGNEIIG